MNANAKPQPEEIVRRGEEIYESKLRAELEPSHLGEYLMIDVQTGDFELDPDLETASKRAAAKHPAGWWYGKQIGSRTLWRLGGRRVEIPE